MVINFIIFDGSKIVKTSLHKNRLQIAFFLHPGDQGFDGEDGKVGMEGLRGLQGPDGAPGPQGEPGLKPTLI